MERPGWARLLGTLAFMILLGDPRVKRVPVHECGEPFADVTTAGLALDERERDADGTWGHVRQGVLDRLRAAAAELPAGFNLLIVEGHRSQKEQGRRFAAQADGLRRSGITDADELHQRTSMFVSPVDVAPHCAGAAVDLTLIDGDGTEVDMGCPVNGHRHGTEHLCPMHAAGIPAAARHNRAILAKAMSAAGLVNYPPEWWHWSYGDRYWALTTGADNAIYGPV